MVGFSLANGSLPRQRWETLAQEAGSLCFFALQDAFKRGSVLQAERVYEENRDGKTDIQALDDKGQGTLVSRAVQF